MRAFQILSESNPTVDMRQLSDLLGQVTADNGREVLDAFTRQTTREFRINTAEWNLMIERVGEVAGATARAGALTSTKRNDHERARALITPQAIGGSTGTANTDRRRAAAPFTPSSSIPTEATDQHSFKNPAEKVLGNAERMMMLANSD